MPLMPGKVDIPNKMLIEEIRRRPELYDKTLPGYAKSELKRNLWTEVAENVCPQNWKNWNKMQRREAILAMQKRWGNLRTSFAREVKRKIKSKAGPKDDDKKYRYYDIMKFLCKFLAIRVIEGEEDSVQLQDSMYEDNESDEHNNTFESNGSDQRNSTFDANGPNRRNSETNELDNEEDWQEEYEEQYLEDTVDNVEHRNDSENDTDYEIGSKTIVKNEEVYEVVRTDLGDPLKGSLRQKRARQNNIEHIYDTKRRKVEHVDNAERRKVEQVDDINIIKVEQVGDAKSIDQDTNFVLSLAPMLKRLPLNKKIKAQIELLKVFQRMTENYV